MSLGLAFSAFVGGWLTMDATLLARIQFGLTVGFHFIFPAITIGMAWLIFIFMTAHLRTGDDVYRRMARFWLRIFAVCFAMGVATGIVMEFQFGTNWSEYSRYVGDIFGAPLAIEAVFAFFLESSFLGILLLGWNRVSRRTHWFSSLMVALGATISAFWILVANSWQQTPAGFRQVGGRAELVDFWAAVFNPSTVPRFLHTVTATLVCGAFFVMGISAWYLLKKRHEAVARKSFAIALVVACVASLAVLFAGDMSGKQVARTQPEKLAAIEGVFETSDHAPVVLFGYISADAEPDHGVFIKLPWMLSMMAYGSPEAVVKGLNDFPREDWPPLGLTFYPFHIMVYLGGFFILFTLVGVWKLWRRRLWQSTGYLKTAVASIALPIVAVELGWIAAECGRQPWVVYRILRTADAASPTVGAGHVLGSLIMFSLIYVLLFVVWVSLLRRIVRRGPPEEAGVGGESGKEVTA